MVHIFSFIIKTYLKKFKVQNSVLQNYLPELYPLYSPSYQICFHSFHFTCCPRHVRTALPLSPNLLFEEDFADGWRITHQDNLPHQIAFLCNHPIQGSFIAAVIAVVSFFLTSGFMYRYIMLILINQRLLNLICSMKKVMNGQNSSREKSQPLLHLSMLFGKPCFNYCLFSSLRPPFFISNFINFFWFHSSCDYIAYELIKYIHIQIIESKPDETPYVML